MQYQSGPTLGRSSPRPGADARQHAEPLAGAIEPHPARSAAGRRLRIGYVSADFREHPVVSFLEPILAAHDRHRFEIVCYANVPQPDATTRRLQGHADHWRSLIGLSDAQAAGRIRQDDIDILVDLAGHTGGNRLRAFARKPAPIQVSYLGYLGTTEGHGLHHHGRSCRPPWPIGGALPGAAHPLARVRVLLCPGPAPEVTPSRRHGSPATSPSVA